MKQVPVPVFHNNNLEQTVSKVDDAMILDGSEFFDEEYAKMLKLKVI